MQRLIGRAVLVTGSTGIAAASARRFAAEGARVFVVSRDAAHAGELARAIHADGGEADSVAADLQDDAAAGAAVEAALRWAGRLDGLLNVAGGSGRAFGDGPLDTLDGSAWRRTLELNATTHVLVTAPVLRAMLEQAPDADGMRGAVVNMSSVLATRPVAQLFGTHAYAAAKGAIEALTRASAAHYAPLGIRINAVAPALTTTPMSRRAAADPDTVEFARRKQPLTRGFVEPDDVASAALFLLSAEARAVTGQVLAVDGGWSVTELA